MNKTTLVIGQVNEKMTDFLINKCGFKPGEIRQHENDRQGKDKLKKKRK
jgi:hypothetical protein